MFNLFKNKEKNNEDNDDYDPDRITTFYEGEVMSQGDYEAYTLNRNDPSSKQEYPHHMLVPNGLGKITYKDGDQIIEEYEGEFHVGQYNGQGKLVFKNKVYKGLFLINQFVEEAEISSISDA